MFSILIPSWNNLDCLKLCIAAVRKNSAYDHEIIVHVNEGEDDGTLDWIRAQKLKYSHSKKNVGICLAVNRLAAQAGREWLLYLNDDMVVCPGWDGALIEAARAVPNSLALLSSRMIEPVDSGNAMAVVQNFGRSPRDFDEARLLANYPAGPRGDSFGGKSQPTLIHRMWWHIVGGYSIEYGPGLSSDDDLMMKLWVVGCRHFRIVDQSRVYHFAEQSTRRVRRNRGGRTFVMKWGITQQEFHRDYLAKCDEAATRSSPALPHASLLGKIRRLSYGLGDYPLGDLGAFDPTPGCNFDKV